MKRAVHAAAVEEVSLKNFDWSVDWGFRAVCLETGTVCDAFGFDEANAGSGTEADAMETAVAYLGDVRLHLTDSEAFCDARHVLETGAGS